MIPTCSRNRCYHSIPLLLIVMLLFATTGAMADGFGYPYAPGGTVLQFPQDEGVHTDASVTQEWWYVNYAFRGSAPGYHVYTGMVCYFRPLSLRLVNIGDANTGEFHYSAIPGLGSYTFAPGHLELTYNYPTLMISDYWRWTYPTDSTAYKYVLHATDFLNGDSLNLTMTSNKLPLIVGGDGYIGIGTSGDSSFYYSLTNLKVTGTISCGFRHDSITAGVAWLDRQYGPFFVNPQSPYEWYSIQVDNPGATWGVPTENSAELNIWQVFDDAGNVAMDPTGRLLSARYGSFMSDSSSTFLFERFGFFRDPDGERYFSQGWRLIDTRQDVCLEYEPMIENQMLTVGPLRYWEGGCWCRGTVAGRPASGVAFSELPYRRSTPITPPGAPTNVRASSRAGRNTIKWHASVPGTNPLGGYRVYRAVGDSLDPVYLGHVTDTIFVDSLDGVNDTRYFVSSFDNRSATMASRRSAPAIALSVENGYATADGEWDFATRPNPARGRVTFNVPQGTRIEVFDAAGRRLFHEEGAESMTWLPGADVEAGVYLVQARRGEDIRTRKLVLLP